MPYAKIQKAVEVYYQRYKQIFKHIRMRFDSAGYTERNLSTNFMVAFEQANGCDGNNIISWFECPFRTQSEDGTNRRNYFDSVIFDDAAQSLYIIEAKRSINTTRKQKSIKRDLSRVIDNIDNFLNTHSLTVYKNIYAIFLGDIWDASRGVRRAIFTDWKNFCDREYSSLSTTMPFISQSEDFIGNEYKDKSISEYKLLLWAAKIR